MATSPVPDLTQDSDSDLAALPEPAIEPLIEYSLLARVGAEIFGTFVLVFLGVGAALFSAVNPTIAGGLGVPLGFGIGVLAAISAVGHVSGGHFNPAVSLGAAIGGRIGWADLLPYWVAQIIGGVLAGAVLFVLIPGSLVTVLAQGGQLASDSATALFAGTANGYDAHSPLFTLSGGQTTFGLGAALIVEVAATAIFVGIILGVTDKRTNVGYAPAAIGLSLAVLLMVAAPITNGSLNPARSTAAALFSAQWGQLWLFWVAPLLGGAIAAVVYRAVTPQATTAGEWPELDPAAVAAARGEVAEAGVIGASGVGAVGSTAPAAADRYGDEVEPDAIDALLARQAAALPGLEVPLGTEAAAISDEEGAEAALTPAGDEAELSPAEAAEVETDAEEDGPART